ncbi:MAG: M23 family metallopeptidase [Oscillospiraceae bacterium]|nr:M23 family metallopeptidase [Oscillospiraceae bacterium]
MTIDKKEKGKKLPLNGKIFYIVLALCLGAAGIGTWGAVNSRLEYGRLSEEQSEEQTVDWANAGTRKFPIIGDDKNGDEIVNAPVTDVPDDRKQTPPEEEPTEAVNAAALPYTGEFAMPLGTNIIKDFSNGEMVRSKTMGDWRAHNGIDFGDNRGQPVLAIQDGTVTAVYTDELWGTVLVIDHGHGLTAKYCGLTESSAPAAGTHVEQYEIIGALGEIPVEKDDGPHLHLEITVSGKTVDPLKAMNKS